MRKSVLIFLSFVFLIQGCATARRSRESQKDQSAKSPLSTESSPLVSQEVYGPSEVSPQKELQSTGVRPIVLVLGPGFARGFAYVGVFRALTDSKIPIGAIYGTEMGGLIGALYAVSANMNQFEWALQKLKGELFQPSKNLLSFMRDEPNHGNDLLQQLKNIFGKKDLSQLKIPLKIAIQSQESQAVLVLDRGSLVQALRAAMAEPGRLTPSYWPQDQTGTLAVSAAVVRPFLVEEAKLSGIGPVVVIDVSDRGGSVDFYDHELQQADLVIRPNVKDVSLIDFKKKTELAYRGKEAVKKRMSDILSLVGMSDSVLKRSEDL